MVIDGIELVRSVRNFASMFPNNVYKEGLDGSCAYTRGKNSHCPTEGCIIGNAFLAFGNAGKDLAVAGDRYPSGPASARRLARLAEEHGLFSFSSEQVAWLEAVQREQDNSKTWAVAVERADEIFHPEEQEKDE